MQLTKAARLARQLMNQHSMGHIPFAWDHARTRYGALHYYRNNGKIQKLTLSKHLTPLRDEADVRDTILHEIAHAKVGPQAGHNRLWKAHALAIGAKPVRCGNDATVQAPWIGICPSCNRVFERHRLRRDIAEKATCVACCNSKGHPYERFTIKWTRR